jgi:hypothetical protein
MSHQYGITKSGIYELLFFNLGAKSCKCFEVTNNDAWRNLLSDFNVMNSKDGQDSYLTGLIALNLTRRRRSQCVPEESGAHSPLA